jgi:hypothetical protein
MAKELYFGDTQSSTTIGYYVSNPKCSNMDINFQSNSPSWLRVQKGDGNLTVLVDGNNSYECRGGTILTKVNNVSCPNNHISVTQLGKKCDCDTMTITKANTSDKGEWDANTKKITWDKDEFGESASTQLNFSDGGGGCFSGFTYVFNDSNFSVTKSQGRNDALLIYPKTQIQPGGGQRIAKIENIKIAYKSQQDTCGEKINQYCDYFEIHLVQNGPEAPCECSTVLSINDNLGYFPSSGGTQEITYRILSSQCVDEETLSAYIDLPQFEGVVAKSDDKIIITAKPNDSVNEYTAEMTLNFELKSGEPCSTSPITLKQRKKRCYLILNAPISVSCTTTSTQVSFTELINCTREDCVFPKMIVPSVSETCGGEVTFSLENGYDISGQEIGFDFATGQEKYYDYVDLGLPSGTMWATTNIGSSSIIGIGKYFNWGDDTSGTTRSENPYTGTSSASCHTYRFGDSYTATEPCPSAWYDMCNDKVTYSKYNSADTKTTLEICDDTAKINWGGNWRMPTKADCEELITYCCKTVVEDYMHTGLRAIALVSKINGKGIVLMASAGSIFGCNASDPLSSETSTSFFTSSINNDGDEKNYTRAYCFDAKSNGLSLGTSYRFVKRQIRPVFKPNESADTFNGHVYVDFDLPSKTKWATVNIGANTMTDSGLYFSWANKDGHYGDNSYLFSIGNYNSSSGGQASHDNGAINDSNNLIYDYDTARANWGGKWLMPTSKQCQELVNNTDQEFATINGVQGVKFMKKTNHNLYIFLPDCGTYNYPDSGTENRHNIDSAYWTKTNFDGENSISLFVGNDTIEISNSDRYYGLPIRPVITRGAK